MRRFVVIILCAPIESRQSALADAGLEALVFSYPFQYGLLFGIIEDNIRVLEFFRVYPVYYSLEIICCGV